MVGCKGWFDCKKKYRLNIPRMKFFSCFVSHISRSKMDLHNDEQPSQTTNSYSLLKDQLGFYARKHIPK